MSRNSSEAYISILERDKRQSYDIKMIRLGLYADADFAGLFGAEDEHDPFSVNSCTGLLLNFGGAPVYWISTNQSENSLSTLEAEYIVLS